MDKDAITPDAQRLDEKDATIAANDEKNNEKPKDIPYGSQISFTPSVWATTNLPPELDTYLEKHSLSSPSKSSNTSESGNTQTEVDNPSDIDSATPMQTNGQDDGASSGATPEENALDIPTNESNIVALEETADGSPPLPPVTGSSATDSDNSDDDAEEDDDDDEEDELLNEPMTLREHLLELRKRVTRAFLIAIVGFCVCYPFAREFLTFVLAPVKAAIPESAAIHGFGFTSPAEAFFAELKVAFLAGIFLTSPAIFYQFWAFIAPGLYDEEKHFLIPVALSSALLFLAGTSFCYFIAFPFAFNFLLSYSVGDLYAMLKISDTLGFVIQLLLAFGFIFEFPLAIFFLARFGIVTAQTMRNFRRYAIIVNVIVAAVLTPPDVVSQMLMAIPLLLLYELSILIAAVFGKEKEEPTPTEEEDDDEDDDDSDENNSDNDDNESSEEIK